MIVVASVRNSDVVLDVGWVGRVINKEVHYVSMSSLKCCNVYKCI